jgi:prevent-host-death family protein
MKIVSLDDAKSDLSRLIEGARQGEPFIIAKAGTPLVQVTAIATGETQASRIGFMAGRIDVPADIDDLGRDEVTARFSGTS